MTNILINGANGTMGRVVAALAQKQPDQYHVAAGVDCAAGTGDGGFPIYPSFEAVKESYDVILDFSAPAALPAVLEAAVKQSCGAVIATTGLSEQDREMIRQASEKVPLFLSANMSLGVNLQIELIKRAASFFGEQYDIEIIEKHHNQKVDAPSGTALTLADALATQFAEGKDYVFDRSQVREKRKKNQIGLSAVRGGTLVGEHQVLFLGEDEVLEINHIAHSKRIFAVGALRAATFLVGQPPRLYSMAEVLAKEKRVTNVTVTPDQAIITLVQYPYSPTAIAKLFASLGDINIDMISKSVSVEGKGDISFTLSSTCIADVQTTLKKLGIDHVFCHDRVSKCCVEGDGMEYVGGVAAEIFQILSEHDIEPLMISTSESNISFCLDEQDIKNVVQSLSRHFELS